MTLLAIALFLAARYGLAASCIGAVCAGAVWWQTNTRKTREVALGLYMTFVLSSVGCLAAAVAAWGWM